MSATVDRHPAWFGAVMGTAATSVVLLLQGQVWDVPWLTPIAVAFLLLATVLALVLWPRYARRLGDRPALAAELADPGHGAMLAVFPAGLLLLAAAWGRVGPEIVPGSVAVWIDIVLLVLGAVIALGLGVRWAAGIASGTHDLAAVHGGWIIPPVMNMIVAVALLPVIAAYPQHAALLVVIGLAFLGVGLVLFLVVLTLLVARLALRPSTPAQLAPSLWIPLAPAGVMGFALLRLLQAGEAAGLDGFTSATAGVVVASMGIGLGMWWALFALVEMRRMRRAGAVPFHPGWWGFVFPIAAMVLSITAVGQAMALPAVEAVGAVGAIVLVVVWATVAVRSVTLLRTPR